MVVAASQSTTAKQYTMTQIGLMVFLVVAGLGAIIGGFFLYRRIKIDIGKGILRGNPQAVQKVESLLSQSEQDTLCISLSDIRFHGEGNLLSKVLLSNIAAANNSAQIFDAVLDLKKESKEEARLNRQEEREDKKLSLKEASLNKSTSTRLL